VPTFRCTRNDVYPEDCPGSKNVSARQGHYVTANNPEDALYEMRRRYPDDDGFTVQLWEGPLRGTLLIPHPAYNPNELYVGRS